MRKTSASADPLGAPMFSEAVGGAVFRSLLSAGFMSGLSYATVAFDTWAEPGFQVGLACVLGGLALVCFSRLLTLSRFHVHENGIRSVSLLGSREIPFGEVLHIHPVQFGGEELRTSYDGKSDVYHWKTSVVTFTARNGTKLTWRWFEDDVAPISAGSSLSLHEQMKTKRTAAILSVYSAAASNLEEQIEKEGFCAWGRHKRITSRGIDVLDPERQCWVEVPCDESRGSTTWVIERGQLSLGRNSAGEAVFREAVDYASLFPGLLVLDRRAGEADSQTLLHVLIYKEYREMNGLQRVLMASGLISPEMLVGWTTG